MFMFSNNLFLYTDCPTVWFCRPEDLHKSTKSEHLPYFFSCAKHSQKVKLQRTEIHVFSNHYITQHTALTTSLIPDIKVRYTIPRPDQNKGVASRNARGLHIYLYLSIYIYIYIYIYKMVVIPHFPASEQSI